MGSAAPAATDNDPAAADNDPAAAAGNDPAAAADNDPAADNALVDNAAAAIAVAERGKVVDAAARKPT